MPSNPYPRDVPRCEAGDCIAPGVIRVGNRWLCSTDATKFTPISTSTLCARGLQREYAVPLEDGTCYCPFTPNCTEDEMTDRLPEDDGTDLYPPPQPTEPATLQLLVEVDTTGKPEHVETVVQRELDHRFRGHVRVFRIVPDDKYGMVFVPLSYDPVLDDGHPPKDYVPHGMPVVDHRGQRQ